MAISIGRAIASALSGTVKGLAKGAVAADERRDKYTQVALAAGIKKAQELEDQRLKDEAEAAEEIEGVKQIMSISPDGKKMFTKAEATKIYRTGKAMGMNPAEVLEKYTISSEKGGVLVPGKAKKRSVLPSLEGVADSNVGGFFGVSDTEGVAEEASELLKASGYDDVIEMPAKTSVEGVTLKLKEDPDFSVTTNKAYLYKGGDNPVGVQVITYYNKKDPTKPPRSVIQDLRGGVIKVDPTDPNVQILGSLKPGDGSDIGPIMIGVKGGYEPYTVDGVPQIGIRDGLIVYEQNADGSKGEIIENAVILGKTDTRSGQDLLGITKASKTPQFKEFHTQFTEMVGLHEQAAILDERIGFMMEKNRQIGDAGYSAGGFLTTALNSGIKVVSSSAAFVNDLVTSDRFQGASEEAQIARYNYVESQESVLRELVKAGDSLTEGLDEVQARAIRMQQLQAEAILLAYDLAKATGDTRISNQDFDAFIQTVKGNSVESTHALLKRAGERVLTRYKAKYENVTKTYLPATQAIADQTDAATQASIKFYADQLSVGNRFDPEIIDAKFKRTAEQYSPEPKIPSNPKIGKDFTTEKVTLEDGKTVLRITLSNGGTVDLENPKYLNSTDEDIAKALGMIGQAKEQ